MKLNVFGQFGSVKQITYYKNKILRCKQINIFLIKIFFKKIKAFISVTSASPSPIRDTDIVRLFPHVLLNGGEIHVL